MDAKKLNITTMYKFLVYFISRFPLIHTQAISIRSLKLVIDRNLNQTIGIEIVHQNHIF